LPVKQIITKTPFSLSRKNRLDLKERDFKNGFNEKIIGEQGDESAEDLSGKVHLLPCMREHLFESLFQRGQGRIVLHPDS
jgi:hypothetical protein